MGRILAVGVAMAMLLSVSVVAGAKKKDKKTTAAAQMDEEKTALHALNRLTFGPRPGDVEHVRAMGVDKWIDEQLHPEHIRDDALEARLAPLLTLKMDTREMVENFPPLQVLKAIDEGKMSLPSDSKKRAYYEAELVAYRQRKQRKQDANQEGADTNPPVEAPSSKDKAARREARLQAEEQAEMLLDMPAEQRYQALLRMSPDERRMVARGLEPDDRERIMNEFTPRQRETVMATIANPQQVVVAELQEGKLLRAIYSECQLQEVMADFWFNHFNIFLGKGADRYLVTSYERDVIRPHALGKFKDLLQATAKSPAMLFYLDNWLSVGPHSEFAVTGNRNRARGGRGGGGLGRRGPIGGVVFGAPVYRPPRPQRPADAQKQAKNKRHGLNENYGRELMELHTLGVNGGYSQSDVTEVAKVFTGWTIKQPRQGGGFEFNERMHEPGPKYVLGHTIKEHGEKEGQQVLELLAQQPATARFVCGKLAMRFVADDPPPALVDRMAETFLKKDGDIREVLRTMFRSPEFWAPQAYRAKVKTPLEFVASAVRATGADVSNPMPLVQTLNRMGMPLYGMQPPTGYSMKADAWVNTSALLDRMNFALVLGTGRMNGLRVDPARIDEPSGAAPDPSATLAVLESALLAGDVSSNTHATILKQMSDPQVTGRRLDDPQRPPNAGVLAGLLLGSPEFQRR
jgi:uncharacterized protein (DUF1800 family)